jgi:HlyD family secretion protein
MNIFRDAHSRRLIDIVGALVTIFFIASCSHPPLNRFQGSVEGEFVYVARRCRSAAIAERATRATSQTGDPLFAPDETMERAALIRRRRIGFAEAEHARQKNFIGKGRRRRRDFDRALSTRDQDRQRLAQAEWNFSQKRQAAPQNGLVYDTLYREGEWVAAGKPVVVLLPPQNIKVRAFVPEARAGSIHYNDTVRVTVDGVTRRPSAK